MVILKGQSVFGGVAMGKLRFFHKEQRKVRRVRVEDPQAELSRFGQARKAGAKELSRLYEKALVEVGEANAAIFQVHRMLMEDPDYCDSVENIILSQQVNAEFAIAAAADNLAAIFSAMEDAYMQGRAADVRDISERLLHILSGAPEQEIRITEPVIIAADDLTPSETIRLDRDKVLGFATMYGSSSSHTAILARTMNIPAVIGLGEELKEAYDGHMAAVDGFSGMVYVDPDEETACRLEGLRRKAQERRELLSMLKGKETVTRDGRRVRLYANISHFSDLGQALQNDAEGIGLFRSEFLYLESQECPGEEEQFRAYRQTVEGMAGKKVIIRTLDIGADKTVEYFHQKQEENPALGCRGIRFCLSRPEIFKTQLRALYRASAYGNLSIMFPMVISVEEVRQARAIVQKVQEELEAEGLPFKKDVELGIMVETPAAALISDLLAPEVDFFSIGTNDLAQYTLAIDRGNPDLQQYCAPHHPALLRLIRQVCHNAHTHGKWCGICGELAGDLALTETFLDMGIDELSVACGLVLDVRKKVRETGAGKGNLSGAAVL